MIRQTARETSNMRRNAMPYLRGVVLAALFAAPLGGMAVANSMDDGAKSMSGAGFVLYVSLMRAQN